MAASKVEVTNQDPRMENVRVELENLELWQEFCDHGTEMILTKLGRRMFPDLKFTITGLEQNQYYFVLLDIVPTDEYRYKFMAGCWMPAYKSDAPPHKKNLYTHPDSPALGAKWSTMKVTFNKLKLTNNVSPTGSNAASDSIMVLNSMHRYTPRLHIFRGSDIARLDTRNFTTFAFPVTSFMAVTAYQNAEVTHLKIRFNPFAKGFRDDDRRTPLKRSSEGARLMDGSDGMPEIKSSRPNHQDPCTSVEGLTPPPTPLSEIQISALPKAESPQISPSSYPTYDASMQLRNPFDHRLLTPPNYTFPTQWLPYMYPGYLRQWIASGAQHIPNPYMPYMDPRFGYPNLQ